MKMPGFFKRLLFLAGVLSTLAVAALAWFAWTPLALNNPAGAGRPLDFSVPAGYSLRAISRHLVSEGMDFSPWQFTLMVRLLGKAGAIQAGSYEIAAGTTPWQLLKKLTRGDVSQSALLFVEGMNFRQLRAALDAHPDLLHDTQGLSEQEILQQIGAAETHAEGLFFPDTYLFSKRSSDVELLRRAYQAMQQRLAQAWAQRADGLPLRTPYDALILASIVEKETGRAEDRALVASVFINRLRIGMALQTDPTVIYGMGERFDGNLRKRDLQTDTPYNTYRRPGLPPTPIAMPGQAALDAALQPVRSDKLYFVARGDGSSEFSRNLNEHNRAVNLYQRGKGRNNP
ncbi:MAG: endolytic transglycosylase MltG [Sterolibacterium sp.]|nr:endolytic transglycosylase MltG [Sterolibacterium sp.]